MSACADRCAAHCASASTAAAESSASCNPASPDSSRRPGAPCASRCTAFRSWCRATECVICAQGSRAASSTTSSTPARNWVRSASRPGTAASTKRISATAGPAWGAAAGNSRPSGSRADVGAAESVAEVYATGAAARSAGSASGRAGAARSGRAAATAAPSNIIRCSSAMGRGPRRASLRRGAAVPAPGPAGPGGGGGSARDMVSGGRAGRVRSCRPPAQDGGRRSLRRPSPTG